MRPGILYGAVFIWFVFTGGRFTAPFLQKVAGFDDGLIGSVFAAQVLAGSFFGSLGAIASDKMENLYPQYGRVLSLIVCVLIGTISFELHFWVEVITKKEEVQVALHFLARILYAICTSSSCPILDAIVLTNLKEGNSNECDYGRERLFGKLQRVFVKSRLLGLGWNTNAISCFENN